MLQYVEIIKQEYGYKTVPEVYVEFPDELIWNAVGLWAYEGIALAVVEQEHDERSTTVIAEGQGFICAVLLPPVPEGGKWTSNKLVYKQFMEVAASGNYDRLEWAINLQELGLSDCNRIATLLASETIPYVWGQVVENLVGYLGMNKFLRFVHKTTYKDREGKVKTVDQEFIWKTGVLYRNLNFLGYYHPDKPNQNKDWRDLYRHLFDWFQEVRPEVQIPATPELAELDGLNIDHGYKLALPWSNVTLSQWGVDLDNCLGDYTDQLLEGYCEVLGVFKDSRLVASVEIINRRITQLYGYDNSEPDRLLADAVITVLRQSGVVE